MASQAQQLHFVLFPFMAPGHMNPMMDIAKLLLQRNIIVTVVTTPINAARFTPAFARYIEGGFRIKFVELRFPCKEAGLPDGCENLDLLPSLGTEAMSFFNAANSLLQPAEKLFRELTPPPNCIISDMCLPYISHIAKKFEIPRISFVGVSCFYLVCAHNLLKHNVLQSITTESEHFAVPDIPDKIEITKAQIGLAKEESWKPVFEEMFAVETTSYGMIMNSFEELEPAYAWEYKKIKNDKIWCIGPVSLCNKDELDKAQRGNKVSIDACHLKWLDSQKPNSVVYACLGSLCNLLPEQLIELGLALEASEKPFIWVIKKGNQLEELEKWFKEDGFEERIKGRSLLIRGWAPQLLVLSHSAIGGFITHCGWNSTMEAICAGVPMVTWPLFGDQFLNEAFVVQILKVGVKVGVDIAIKWGEEENFGVRAKKEDVEIAIVKLMDESNESQEIRKRIRQLADMAKKAVEKEGSSHRNLTLLTNHAKF